MSDGSANKDRKKYCAWRGLSIKGQSFLTDLSSNRNDKKGEWQEEKSRGREIRRLASMVPVLALLAVFSSDIQSAENGAETNRSRQKTEQLCCHGGQPATCLLFPRPFGIWGRTLHLGQHTPRGAGRHESRQLPLLSGPRCIHVSRWGGSPGRTDCCPTWSLGNEQQLFLRDLSLSVSPAQPSMDFHTVPSHRGSRGSWGSPAPLLLFDMHK